MSLKLPDGAWYYLDEMSNGLEEQHFQAATEFVINNPLETAETN